jgi:hypothetical protein
VKLPSPPTGIRITAYRVEGVPRVCGKGVLSACWVEALLCEESGELKNLGLSLVHTKGVVVYIAFAKVNGICGIGCRSHGSRKPPRHQFTEFPKRRC